MRRLAVAIFLIVGTLGSAALWAQPAESQKGQKAPKKSAKAPQTDEEDPKDEKRRNQHSRSLTKIRRGSILRSERPEEVARDLRGEYERRRDHEVIRHFSRLAELDVITKVAADTGDEQLVSEVEAVRRAELDRFRRAMQRLQKIIRTRLATGLP